MTTTALRPRTLTGRQLVRAGFWCLIAFVGASVIASQIVLLANGASAVDALGGALAGFAIALFGVLHAVLAINTVPAVPSKRTAGLGLIWRNDVDAQTATGAHR